MKYSLEYIEKIEIALMEADQDIRVDKFELDEECTKQSVLYNKYSSIQADLEDEKNNLKAELNNKIREEFLAINKKQPSEAYVKMAIESDRNYLRLLFYISKFEGKLKSLEHKKRCLEKLVDLAISGYYAEPKRR